MDTKSAEASLTRLSRKIKDVQNAVNKTSKSNTKLDSAIKKAVTTTNKLNTATKKVANTAAKVANATNKINTANIKAKKSAQQLSHSYSQANKSAHSLLGTVKKIATAYLGLQGLKLGITASDTITSSQNKLNNIKGGNPRLTAESMDKMYVAAQRSRSLYSDMLSNVSKTMTLAGDSFQGNIDNAIRFQEIMAKAYTVGGASATEASTSMYQLVQALGSGILQGDELRSVREGAPIAYKKIEEFAQGVFHTEESLKDLASQGVITSDIIVAAIMSAEDEINKSFENTKMTFAQAGDSIKNVALKAFQPALEKLNEILNSDAGQQLIEGIGLALIALGNALTWVVNILGKFFTWCADNWEWLKYIVTGALLVIIALLVKQAAIAIWNALVNIAAFVAQYWALLLIVAGVMAILYVYEKWREGSISTTEAIVSCLAIIAAMFVILAIVSLGWIGVIIAAVIAVIALIITYFSELCGYIWVGIQAIVDGALWVANVFIGAFKWICAVGYNTFAGIANFAIALKNAIVAIAQNIGIAFCNAWNGALSSFWNFIASCVEGLDWLAKPLESIAKLFGKNFSYDGFASGLRDKANAYAAKQQDYVSVSGAWNSGMNTYQYKDLGDAWSNGYNTFDTFEKGWAKEAYNTGSAWGQGVEDKVNAWGAQFQNKSSSYGGIFEDVGNKLGISSGALPSVSDPSYALGNAYDPTGANTDIADGLKKLNDTTDDISDKMDITDDDLEYLRKIAEMEWRNEFTTAEIRIDMTNNNTVNGERDLDGIVAYLGEVLRSEMTSIAEGVHY